MEMHVRGGGLADLFHHAPEFDLGYVGLAQFLPGILLFLVSGHVADNFNRQKLMMPASRGFALCSLLLLICAYRCAPHIPLRPIYAVIVLLGVVRSLNGPVGRALLPHLVREEHFQNAVAWHSTIFQVGDDSGSVSGRTDLRGVSAAPQRCMRGRWCARRLRWPAPWNSFPRRQRGAASRSI